MCPYNDSIVGKNCLLGGCDVGEGAEHVARRRHRPVEPPRLAVQALLQQLHQLADRVRVRVAQVVDLRAAHNVLNQVTHIILPHLRRALWLRRVALYSCSGDRLLPNFNTAAIAAILGALVRARSRASGMPAGANPATTDLVLGAARLGRRDVGQARDHALHDVVHVREVAAELRLLRALQIAGTHVVREC